MLIFGNKYEFSDFEKVILNKKFKTIMTIHYNNEDYENISNKIENTLSNDKINIIVLNIKTKIPDDIIKYITNLQFKKNIKLITIEHFFEKYFKKCYIPEDNTNLDYLENIKAFNFIQYFQKRLIDYIGVIILLIFTFPILLYARKKIKEQSPGTSIFRQSRIGKDGKIFKCVKFRSMHQNSHHDPYTRQNDNRIFPFGNIMRKTRLDELPQMLNVLAGDMHLIGPRAEWDILVKEYEKSIPYYQERHLVKPGITGWAQVNYPYGSNIKDAKQKLMYDLYYIKNWSLWLEFKTIYKTLFVILEKKGL